MDLDTNYLQWGSHPASSQGKRCGASSSGSKFMWYTLSISIGARHLNPAVSQSGFMKKRIVVNHVCMYVCAAMPLNAAMQFVTVRSRHCRFNRNAHRKCGNAASMCEGLRHCRAYMLRHCRFAQSTCGIAARSKIRWACSGM